MTSTTNPLIACTPGPFCNSLQILATNIGADFLSTDDLDQTFKECDRRDFSCVVIETDRVNQLSSSRFGLRHDEHFLFFVIPAGDVRSAFAAAKFGADNVFEKPVGDLEIVKNVQTAFASDSQLKTEINQDNHQRFSSAYFSELKEREKKVLTLLMNGEPNKRVAALLDIGLRTVESDRANVMRKLQVDSFAQLIQVVAKIEGVAGGARKTIYGNSLVNKAA